MIYQKNGGFGQHSHKHVRRIFLLILLSFLCPSFLLAQKANLKFDHITPRDGLSHNVVFAIHQDHKGFMWFATQDGLNLYDGYTFRTYQHDPLDASTIPESDIRAIYEDRNGILWLGSWGGGLIRLVPSTRDFEQFKHDPLNPTSIGDNWITAVVGNGDGTLWIGTQSGGLSHYDPASGKFTTYRHDPDNPNSLSDNHVGALCLDRQGQLWIGTDQGLDRLNLKSMQFTHYTHDRRKSSSLSHNEVRALFIDKDDILWIGTANGLNQFLPESGTFARFLEKKPDTESSREYLINTITQHKDGDLWIGSYGGLTRFFDRKSKLFLHYPHNPNDYYSLSHDDVQALLVDHSENLWIATAGGGLNKVDLKPRKFHHFKQEPATENTLSDNRVYALWKDQSEALWIGTDNGLNKLTRGRSSIIFSRNQNIGDRYDLYGATPNDRFRLTSERILSLYGDQNGHIWAGTDQGLNRIEPGLVRLNRVVRYTSATHELSNDHINAILEDRAGRFWIGTNDGLNMFDPIQDVFVPIYHDPNNANSLSDNRIRALYEDRDGHLWIGTDGGGLNQLRVPDGRVEELDPSTFRFIRYTTRDGQTGALSNNRVLSIMQDRLGVLWVGTFGGLNKLPANDLQQTDPTQVTFKQFTVKDGLPNNAIYGILEDSNGNLWVSTNNGLSNFNVRKLQFRNYDITDGLQSNTFFPGSYHKSGNEMFFGGPNGFNQFHPEKVDDNPYRPAVYLTAFKVFDRDREFSQRTSDVSYIELKYYENFFAFEFSALDFTQPEKNRYEYQLQGFDAEWIDAGTRRYASYTNLDGGMYVFKVRGTNNDGLWNPEEANAMVTIRIIPPFWKTTWFRILMAVIGIFLIILVFIYQMKRLERQKNEALRALELKHQQQELEAARSIQLSMIPDSPPEIKNLEIAARMETANLVGGDYYDFILSPDYKRLYFVIADVSGKGVPASLLMIEARTILHTLGSQDLPPKEMTVQANRHIFNDTQNMRTPMMITMLVLNWTIERELLSYTGAGHEHILIYRGKTRTVDAIKSGGLWLGVEEEIEEFLQERDLPFGTGDAILLYTDGVTEHHAADTNEMYGLDRLRDFLSKNGHKSAQEILDSLFQDLHEFGQGGQQHDDITVLVFKKIA